MEGWQAIVASDFNTILTTWVPGFDQVGAKDLKKLVGSRKWVGTAGQDVTVLISYNIHADGTSRFMGGFHLSWYTVRLLFYDFAPRWAYLLQR